MKKDKLFFSAVRFSPRTRTLLLLSMVLLLEACSGAADNKGNRSQGVPVVVAKVVQKTVPVRLQAVGSVEAYTSVAIKSRVDGQIISTHFKEGQDVTKGQVLFQLDARPFEAQLKQAQSNALKNKAQLEQARAQDRRYQDLLNKNFVSKEFYTQIQTNLGIAEANVHADEATVENARLLLEYTTIRSPIDGRTGKVMIQFGNLVKANDVNALVVINQLTPIYINFSVPEQYLKIIRHYMGSGAIKVDAIVPNTDLPPITGNLNFVDNTVDPTTGTIKLKAVFQNGGKLLWPGQFMNVTLTLYNEPNALVIPSQAVQTGPDGQFVFVIKEDLTAEIRPIVTSRSEGNETVIVKGLSKEERVVINGQVRLSKGIKVNIKAPS